MQAYLFTRDQITIALDAALTIAKDFDSTEYVYVHRDADGEVEALSVGGDTSEGGNCREWYRITSGMDDHDLALICAQIVGDEGDI
jgi:hypothetical protein